ncbi:L10-interacting MYB domain-containing protein-like, partial [Camellia sinensis]|uniref:L10-interacting MYB domain-containing protein-like n=1 Tax=Camellia sinensis TaxID=4442 RepID=UPI001035F769
MANDNDDFKMWGSENVKIFLEILVDGIKKKGPFMSKKDRSFFPRQWQTIDDEMTKKVGKNYGLKKLKGKFARLKLNYKEFVALKNHTGLGWDPITQTVTAPNDVWENYVQAHPNAKQFQTKGLEHYELMSKIFAKSFATGAFVRSSRQGAPTSDDEREMDERFHPYTSGKGVVDKSCTSGSKRKSSGQGQSNKNPKMDDALQSWQCSCEARERFYLQAEANAGAAGAYSVAACMTILKSMALDPSLFMKAMNMFTSLEWRTMFMTMEPEMRYLGSSVCKKLGHLTVRFEMSSSRPNGRQPNNMYDPYSDDDDDDDVMDLHM